MTRILKGAVPFDGVGLLTVDPATLLPTSEVVDARLGVSDRVVLEASNRQYLLIGERCTSGPDTWSIQDRG